MAIRLESLMKIGYALILISLGLMIWASSARAAKPPDPPCMFNSLCTCSSGPDNYGSVKCENVLFPAIPEALNLSKVYSLKMDNTGLREIVPHFLQATGLYRLELSHNPLFDVADEAFSGLERSLWELILSYDGIAKVPTKALRYLIKLRYLDLSGNEISMIERDSFRGLQNSLQTLILADNSISNLNIESFQGLPNLKVLDLSSNNLREISPDVFREQINSLERVILADNLLTEIPYVPVSLLKSVKVLDLASNMITTFQMHHTSQPLNIKLSLEQLHLEYNQIHHIQPASFSYFLSVNQTYLDFNPIHTVSNGAFQTARIRELYLRHCLLDFIEPEAFSGLEGSLQILDLSGNNITSLPDALFLSFDVLQNLNIKENKIRMLFPNPAIFTGFQYSLMKLDMTGDKNGPIDLKDIRRFRNLRTLSIGRMNTNQLLPENFEEFGVELENLRIFHAGLKSIKAHAFMHVRGLKRLDLSENYIENIEKGAFQEVGHTLVSLRITRGLSSMMNQLPGIRELTSLEELDLSNNKLKSISDTAFHSMKNLRLLKINDNLLEQLPKGAFQRDIHQKLEEICLEFNAIRHISTHTFVDLEKLQTIKLRDNKIERLERRAFMNLEKLQHINLKGNKLTSISDEAFQNLPALTFLDLSFNQLKSFDFDYFDQIGTLTHLVVNVSHNALSELTDNTTSFINLREQGTSLYHSNIKVLDMSHNNITWISQGFFKPAEMSLVSLNLAYNYLQNTSREIFGNFLRLRILDLSDNFIEYIAPDTFFRNTKMLQVINLSRNYITELGYDVFRYMNDLRVVDLSHNYLKFIPDNLFAGDDMEKLDFSHNFLVKIPVSSLTNVAAMTLCELDLSHNVIAQIHSMDLSNKFRRLSHLDLSYNKLTRLDDAAFATLPNLAVLDLSHNNGLEVYGRVFIGLEEKLMELNLNNISIFQAPDLALPNLRILKIAYNELPSIPPEHAANLTSLREYDLSYNDLTTVPLITHSLPNLNRLSLAGNPIASLTNTSLLGAAFTLEHLDIAQLPLMMIENGILSKLYSLRSLKLSTYPSLNQFNIPVILEDVDGLRELIIEAPVPKYVKVTKDGFETYQLVQDSASDLRQELYGYLPNKVRSITISGPGFNRLADGIFDGVQSTTLHIKLFNTTLSGLPSSLFKKVGSVYNISIDIDSNNKKLNTLPNPNSAIYPHQPDSVLLTDLNIHNTKLSCDCEIGWIEFWQRKRRQYVCSQYNWDEEALLKSEISYIDDCQDPYYDDDLRSAKCLNKNGEPLLEILKSELECGWSGGKRKEINFGVLIVFMVTFTTFML